MPNVPKILKRPINPPLLPLVTADPLLPWHVCILSLSLLNSLQLMPLQVSKHLYLLEQKDSRTCCTLHKRSFLLPRLPAASITFFCKNGFGKRYANEIYSVDELFLAQTELEGSQHYTQTLFGLGRSENPLNTWLRNGSSPFIQEIFAFLLIKLLFCLPHVLLPASSLFMKTLVQ